MLDIDIFHPILTLWQFAVSAMPIGGQDDNAETVIAELARLAEQKGPTVMNNVASNLFWMFVVCVIA
ncbi:hypothetical protein PENFLA_c041G01833 [Penicillium flavigenum]|uniref:Uncharacterized protein n=1 Tax=Penicillium flavigenum TaxID=254877 RepID=A0A1V6SJG4_9EURO|nr:hypothetical protein PENFLA_c041G01833 [Penicillium flavigenum]